MIWLTPVDAVLIDGPKLPDATAQSTPAAAEGSYVHLSALPPAHQALIAPAPSTDGPVALVLPLDGLFEDRVDTARRLWRALVRGARVKPAGSASSAVAG